MKKHDVIVVLAGGITTQGTLPENVAKRIVLAKKLFNQHAAPRILMSGKWSKYWEHHPPSESEAGLMRKYAISLGIPRKSILTEEFSQNTFENIFYSFKLFIEPERWQNIIIVTSNFHKHRVKRMIDAILGTEYQAQIFTTQTNASLLRRVRWFLKEKMLSHTHRFFQYFVHR